MGAGIAGLGAAWALARRHQVVVYEAEPRVGGHAHALTVRLDRRPVPIETGFIVYNERNYPLFTRLLDHLDVASRPSNMSFSVSLGGGRLEYAGNLRGLAAQPANLLRHSHWAMLADILRFNKAARRSAGSADASESLKLGDYLDAGGYGIAFRERYLLPMAAAIWSSSLVDILDHPASSFIRFFGNHGLLDLRNRPQWRTIARGSAHYVARLVEDTPADTRIACPIRGVHRRPADVLIEEKSGRIDRFDQVVFATPADISLRLLGAAASEKERTTLGAFCYRANRAFLHRDTTMMPRRRRAWASWNYLAEGGGHSSGLGVSLTYWMNSLQAIETREQIFVTLNPLREPRQVEAELLYYHPQYDQAALTAQARLPQLQGENRSWFCGSYCGYGFHEDAFRSGLAVAAALGAEAPWSEGANPRPVLAQAAE